MYYFIAQHSLAILFIRLNGIFSLNLAVSSCTHYASVIHFFCMNSSSYKTSSYTRIILCKYVCVRMCYFSRIYIYTRSTLILLRRVLFKLFRMNSRIINARRRIVLKTINFPRETTRIIWFVVVRHDIRYTFSARREILISCLYYFGFRAASRLLVLQWCLSLYFFVLSVRIFDQKKTVSRSGNKSRWLA